MFDPGSRTALQSPRSAGAPSASGRAAAPAGPVSNAELDTLIARLAEPGGCVGDQERVDRLGLLESLKGAAAAEQARVTVAFADSQREAQQRVGVPRAQRGRGVAEQVALARRESPSRGSRHLGLAQALVHELPHTMAALTAGAITEWRATQVCRETAVLSVEHRREVDARLARSLATLGDRRAACEARRIGYLLDPTSALRRVRGAVTDRRVTLRPAPDAMAILTATLPVAQGVAAYAALDAAASAARAHGEDRTRGQVMADTLVERVTGQSTAEAVPLEVQLVMSAETLLAGGSEPATITGHGPLPAALARELVTQAGGTAAEESLVWLRRLFAHPSSGALVAMDSRRRRFDGLLREFIRSRDQLCRTPWCDAPIRHTDHCAPARSAGRTSAANGAGLCERCNYAKEAPGWASRASVGQSGRHSLLICTPTGHRYTSVAPPLRGVGPPWGNADGLSVGAAACIGPVDPGRAVPTGPRGSPGEASRLEQHFATLAA